MKKFILILLAFTLTGCAKKSSFDLSSLRMYDVPLIEKFRTTTHLKYPYTASFKVKDKELKYLAISHSQNINSPTFKSIKDTVASFQPDLIIIEGLSILEGYSPPSIKTHIHHKCEPKWNTCSELLYAAYLGDLYGIPFIGSEASDEYVFEELGLQGYSTKDIAFFYLTRKLAQYYGEQKIKSWDDLEKDFCRLLPIPPNFKKENYNFKEYMQWLEENVTSPVKFKKFIPSKTSNNDGTADEKNFYIEIRNANVLIRDKHIAQVILDHMLYMPKYKKILIVLGGGHYFTQKDVLTKYLGTPVYKNYDF